MGKSQFVLIITVKILNIKFKLTDFLVCYAETYQQ